ncbi:MAG TPA: hypothetical protein VME69_15655 [Methylocella sp.]|nr:hypothetical protein [Methylocella sp.]
MTRWLNLAGRQIGPVGGFQLDKPALPAWLRGIARMTEGGLIPPWAGQVARHAHILSENRKGHDLPDIARPNEPD